MVAKDSDSPPPPGVPKLKIQVFLSHRRIRDNVALAASMDVAVDLSLHQLGPVEAATQDRSLFCVSRFHPTWKTTALFPALHCAIEDLDGAFGGGSCHAVIAALASAGDTTPVRFVLPAKPKEYLDPAHLLDMINAELLKSERRQQDLMVGVVIPRCGDLAVSISRWMLSVGLIYSLAPKPAALTRTRASYSDAPVSVSGSSSSSTTLSHRAVQRPLGSTSDRRLSDRPSVAPSVSVTLKKQDAVAPQQHKHLLHQQVDSEQQQQKKQGLSQQDSLSKQQDSLLQQQDQQQPQDNLQQPQDNLHQPNDSPMMIQSFVSMLPSVLQQAFSLPSTDVQQSTNTLMHVQQLPSTNSGSVQLPSTTSGLVSQQLSQSTGSSFVQHLQLPSLGSLHQSILDCLSNLPTSVETVLADDDDDDNAAEYVVFDDDDDDDAFNCLLFRPVASHHSAVSSDRGISCRRRSLPARSTASALVESFPRSSSCLPGAKNN